MINLIHWNPKRKLFKGILGEIIPFKKRVNNFGDILSPIIVDKIISDAGIKITRPNNKRLLAIGSILHLAENGDIIWGTGRNGKISNSNHKFTDLDVRMVRGPLTRDFLMNQYDILVPEIYGDPGLLAGYYFPQFIGNKKTYDLTIIPNLNDLRIFRGESNIIDPRSNIYDIFDRISKSKLVVGSSLHAIIIAESFGIPARFIRSKEEHIFKYQDYYLGTGRNEFIFANSIEEAVSMGGEKKPDFNANLMISAFPFDIIE